MPIYERYVIWVDADGHKSVASLGPTLTETQAEARNGAKAWADVVMKRNVDDLSSDMNDICLKSYEIVAILYLTYPA